MMSRYNDNYNSVLRFYIENGGVQSDKFIIQDEDFDSYNKGELTKRDQTYTLLLNAVYDLYTKRNYEKEHYKWMFFKCLMIFIGTMFAGVSFLICYAIIQTKDVKILSSIPAIVGVFVSFLTAIISIPLVIAKYLFNPNEDKEITKLILKMKAQDLKNREMIGGAKPQNQAQFKEKSRK